MSPSSLVVLCLQLLAGASDSAFRATPGVSIDLPRASAEIPRASPAPADSEWRELVDRTDSYRRTKKTAFTLGFVGSGLAIGSMTFFEIALFQALFDGLDGRESNKSDGMLTMAVLTGLASFAVEGTATGFTVATIVKGVQLRQYERKTCYRLSLHPALAPRGAGALARLEF